MKPADSGLTPAPTRRAALSAGGLAIAGAACPRSAAPSRIMFGSNPGPFRAFHAAVPLGRGVRVYYDQENHFPSSWPADHPGTWMTLSLRPNPHDLLSGRLDEQLRAIIGSAPAHSDLTFWHENTSGNPLGYPSYVNNARAAVAMQRYGHRLCRGSKVRFGVITCGPANQQLRFMAPGLDWYGDDLYEFPRLRNPDDSASKAKMYHRLDANLRAWRTKSGRRWPAIRICETNTPFDSQRAKWLTWLAQWMARHNGHRILTYWNPDAGIDHGGLSGPWPPSPDVVRRLRSLSELYQG